MAIESLCKKVVHLPIGNRKEAQTEPSAAHRLEYMVDMLLQLKDMASAGKLHVLSGILEVACQEARTQARRS
jgi:hypothetical protein